MQSRASLKSKLIVCGLLIVVLFGIQASASLYGLSVLQACVDAIHWRDIEVQFGDRLIQETASVKAWFHDREATLVSKEILQGEFAARVQSLESILASYKDRMPQEPKEDASTSLAVVGISKNLAEIRESIFQGEKPFDTKRYTANLKKLSEIKSFAYSIKAQQYERMKDLNTTIHLKRLAWIRILWGTSVLSFAGVLTLLGLLYRWVITAIRPENASAAISSGV